MGRQFILIDPSIASLAGHHYEYAVHVLSAAARAGFEPVLATNRKFRDAVPEGWKTAPVYQYGFWAAMSTPRWDLMAAQARTGWRRLVFRLRCRFRFSAPGMAWLLRDRLVTVILDQPLDRTRLLPLLKLVPIVALYKLVRFLLLLALLPLGVVRAAGVLVWGLVRREKVLTSYLGNLFRDVIRLFDLARILLRRRGDLSKWLQQFRCLRRFTADTRRLFSRVALNPGDVVFIPTISAVELMGLRRFLESDRRAAGASWHLLFRRNLYRGRREDYPSQDGEHAGLRGVLGAFRDRTPGLDVRFYTDTDELSEQYSRLGVFSFRTLPIPHTHQPAEKPPGGPLHLIYVGDARREKGYHLLPHLIQDLWLDYVATGRVRFLLQSNYNLPKGEPEAVVARSQLECLPQDKVRLFKTPLTSDQYKDLLLAGDINLLLYDRENYYARSSGILVEALSAGMPVLAPAGSWLARQFLAPLYRHQQSLREHMEVLRSYAMGRLEWHPHGKPQVRLSTLQGLRAARGGRVYCWVPAPEETCELMVTLWLGQESGEAKLITTPCDNDDQPLGPAATVLVEAAGSERVAVARLPVEAGCAKFWFALSASHPAAPLDCLNLRMDFLKPRPDQPRPPLGAVGLAYDKPEEITPLLEEMIENYPHYRATACEFARDWNAYHNAGRLVGELTGEARS